MLEAIESIKIKISSENGIKPDNRDLFSGGVLNSQNLKIYIVKLNRSYLYIGKTKQKIGDKFRQAFKTHKDSQEGVRVSGYGGYKWVDKYINTKEVLDLFVFDLGENCSNNNAEAIEAELTFLIRTIFGRWPECQNEIHFFNEFENAKEVAIKIFESIK